METKNEARNRQRLTKKIREWLQQYKPVFLTMTFTDEILKNTTEEQRERLIIQYLRSETALYMANKDYGEKNGREHYHAVAVASTLKRGDIEERELEPLKNRVNLEPWQKYGRIESKFIARTYRPLNDYVFTKTALNMFNHFRKPTTNGSRLIVSRGEHTKEEQIARLERLRDYLEALKLERLNKWKENYLKTHPTATDKEAEIMAEALGDMRTPGPGLKLKNKK